MSVQSEYGINWVRYCAPSPFSTSCIPYCVNDPTSPSTNRFFIQADMLNVWVNDKVVTFDISALTGGISNNSLHHRQLAKRGGIAGA